MVITRVVFFYLYSVLFTESRHDRPVTACVWSGDEEPYMMYITGMFFHAVKNVSRFYGKMTGNQLLPGHLL